VGLLNAAQDGIDTEALRREAGVAAEEGRGNEATEEGDVVERGFELEAYFQERGEDGGVDTHTALDGGLDFFENSGKGLIFGERGKEWSYEEGSRGWFRVGVREELMFRSWDSLDLCLVSFSSGFERDCGRRW